MTTFLLITTFLYKVQTALAALISAMLLAPSTSTQMPVQKDTFEKSDRFEYMTNPSDTLGDDVYVLNETELVGNKERGEFFNKWFWSMFSCMDENGKFQDGCLNGAPKYIKVPNQDYRQLAADIISTFDKDGDNKVDFHEYLTKSEELMAAKAGRALPQEVISQFQSDFFRPLFKGFDYDDNNNEYDINELAASLYALDRYSSSGQGILSGERLMDEVNYVLENGRPDKCFEKSRIAYYNEYVIK